MDETKFKLPEAFPIKLRYLVWPGDNPIVRKTSFLVILKTSGEADFRPTSRWRHGNNCGSGSTRPEPVQGPPYEYLKEERWPDQKSGGTFQIERGISKSGNSNKNINNREPSIFSSQYILLHITELVVLLWLSGNIQYKQWAKSRLTID